MDIGKNRNLYRLTRLVIFKFRLLLKFLALFRKPGKKVLVIKTDAIGDYVLFRNYIEVVKNAECFKGYQIDLLGNEVWKEIALKYDAQFIADFSFCKPIELYEAPLKILKLGWQLFRKNYAVVLQPTYTRNLIVDGLAGFTSAKKVIGFESDTVVLQQKFKRRTDKFYTRRLSLPASVYFEFERTRYFFEEVLGQPVELKGPSLDVNRNERNGVIIFPGAGVSKRGWEPSNFAALIRLIMQNSTQPVFVTGGPAEKAIGDYLTENLPPGSFTNLIGKTSLPELIELTGSAALIISNESSAIHIAAATGTPSICILGGGHYGRFAPYPDHMAFKPVCVYEKMPCYFCDWFCKFKTEENEPFPCLGNIPLSEVWRSTKELLPQ